MSRLLQLELPFLPGAPPAEQPRHIVIEGRIIDYRLIRARRRSLGMTIDQRGLRVSATPRTALVEIERFLRGNAAWVLKKLEEWRDHDRTRHLTIRHGATLPVLGEPCLVLIEPGRNRACWSESGLLLQARAGADVRELARRALRERALDLFRERVGHRARQLDLPVPAVALSNAQTRWGSCSERTGIRLSWRLIHAALPLIEYVVAHEVAHLREMNHSLRFWRVVEGLCPEYRARRAELRRFAATCPQL